MTKLVNLPLNMQAPAPEEYMLAMDILWSWFDRPGPEGLNIIFSGLQPLLPQIWEVYVTTFMDHYTSDRDVTHGRFVIYLDLETPQPVDDSAYWAIWGDNQ